MKVPARSKRNKSAPAPSFVFTQLIVREKSGLSGIEKEQKIFLVDVLHLYN